MSESGDTCLNRQTSLSFDNRIAFNFCRIFARISNFLFPLHLGVLDSEEQPENSDLQIDITDKLMQVKLDQLADRIKTCTRHNITFNADVSDLMNRLIGGDSMVNTEIQVIEANLDIITHKDGTLISPMTTPHDPAAAPPEENKVKKFHFLYITAIFRVAETKCIDQI